VKGEFDGDQLVKGASATTSKTTKKSARKGCRGSILETAKDILKKGQVAAGGRWSKDGQQKPRAAKRDFQTGIRIWEEEKRVRASKETFGRGW
jgi:hypothetical protein